jgi:hypothetical protein
MIAEGFDWKELIKHIVVVTFAQVFIVICTALAFVGLIKIFQAKTRSKDKAEQHQDKLNKQ